MKVFILNCFAGNGKDHLAKYLWMKHKFVHREFKAKLFEIAFVMSGISHSDWFTRYDSPQKEVGWDRLGGLSQRQFLIKISEEYIKPVFGKEYFGNALLNEIDLSLEAFGDSNFVISDGGFHQELIPLIYYYGYNNVVVCQWNRDNPDAFKNDSRGWLDGYNTLILPDNDFTDTWTEKCWELIKEKLNE
jgi:hypothetical protein